MVRQMLFKVHRKSNPSPHHSLSLEVTMAKLLIGLVSAYVAAHGYVWLHQMHHLRHLFFGG